MEGHSFYKEVHSLVTDDSQGKGNCKNHYGLISLAGTLVGNQVPSWHSKGGGDSLPSSQGHAFGRQKKEV